MNPIYMLLAIPAFFFCIGLEYLVGKLKKQEYYRFNDAITNLNIGIGSQVFSLFFKGLLLGVFVYFYEHYALFYQEKTIVSFILCLFVFDFLYYWAHRWSHEINFFWGAHVVHHSSEEYNLSVALRQSWIHSIIAFFIFLPLPILGFHPSIFFSVALFVTFYQFWIHTKAIQKLPWIIEYFFNTPSHHRVHHGINPKYIDKNHAATFIIWDRLFGTFQTEEETPTYGITQPIESWDPSWANTHYYAEMLRNARRMTSWKDRFKIIFARPGWLPDYLGGYQAPPKVNSDHQKFDTQTPLILQCYILFQFLLIAFGLMAFMIHFDNISTFYQINFLIIMLLSSSVCAAIFSNKSWVIMVEYVRLIFVLLTLNSFYYFWYLDWFMVMLLASSSIFLLCNIWFTLSWKWKEKRLNSMKKSSL